MAAVIKPLLIEYQSKNNVTGLTDVKAQVYLNGVAKAVGASAIVLTEIDATNAPGFYLLTISAALQTTWGVSNAQANFIHGDIDSVTQPASAPFRSQVTVASTDDLDTKLGTPAGASVSADILTLSTKVGTPAGASVSADIAAVKSDTAAIKTDLETGANSLATINANILALANGSIANGVGYVLPNMLIPASGSNSYRIPITIVNNDGALIDPTGNTVTVGLLNAAGVDRGSFLTGSSGSPAQIAATRISVGQYYVMVAIPSTEVEEDLLFSFAYTIGTNAMVRYGQSQATTDLGSSGFALQSTLLATQTAVNAIKADVENATTGLINIETIAAAVQTSINNGTYGLSALQTIAASIQSTVNNGTYGNSALQTQNVATQAQNTASQGSGFATATDSLHALSVFVRANLFSGGRAV